MYVAGGWVLGDGYGLEFFIAFGPFWEGWPLPPPPRSSHILCPTLLGGRLDWGDPSATM